jgi:hypothetical protein
MSLYISLLNRLGKKLLQKSSQKQKSACAYITLRMSRA